MLQQESLNEEEMDVEIFQIIPLHPWLQKQRKYVPSVSFITDETDQWGSGLLWEVLSKTECPSCEVSDELGLALKAY